MAVGTWGSRHPPQNLTLIKAKTSSLSDLDGRHVQTDVFPHWPMGLTYDNTPLNN